MKDLCFTLEPHFHVKIERLAGEKAEKEIWRLLARATVVTGIASILRNQ